MSEDYPPGFYVTPDGVLHCDVAEVLRSKGIPVTPESIEDAAEKLEAEMRAQLPNAVVEVEQ